MGLIGEVFADAGLHINKASFTEYASRLKDAEDQVSVLDDTSKAAMATGFTAASVAITGVLAYGTAISSTFEDASTTLTTVYGDLDVAKEKFTWLSDFAASTPFEFPELLDATVKLKSYGIEAQDYLGILGDTASAMGKDLNDVVEALADAQTGEFERLKEFGVKAVEITKDNAGRLGASINDIGKTALTYTDQNGKELIKVVDRNSREMVTTALVGVDGIFSKYEGAMETRSKTLTGLMSTLKDNLSLGLADMVGFDLQEMEVQTGSLMGVFKSLLGVAVDLTDGLSEIPEPIQTFITVGAVGGAIALALAGGFFAASLAGITLKAVTVALGVAVHTVLWPATLIVGTLALVAAGLYVLEEKTGLVSAGFGLLYDAATIVWHGLSEVVSIYIDSVEKKIQGFIDLVSGIADLLGLDGLAESISGMFSSIGEGFGGFTETVHEIAEGYRNSGEEIKTASGDAAKGVEDAETSADIAHDSWIQSAYDLLTGTTEAYGGVEEAAQKTKTAYDKAVEDLITDSNTTDAAGISFMSGVDVDDLSRGIRTINDELIILDNNNRLVKVSSDGVVTNLEGMGAVTFETANGAITVMTDGITDAQVESGYLDKLIKDMGNDVVILDNTKLDNLNGQIDTTSGNVINASGNVITWEEALKNSSSVKFDVVNGQVVGMSIAENDATNKANTWNSSLGNINSVPFFGLQGNLGASGGMIDTNTGKTGGWNTSLNGINTVPFFGLQGNLGASGGMIDTNSGKTGDWNTTLGNTNMSPFGSLFGNLGTGGVMIDTNSGKTGDWNSTLGSTNMSPFGLLFGNLITGGIRVDEVKTKTDDANTSMGTLGSFSFSSTITSLGSVYNKLVDIYNQAKTTISKLGEVGDGSSGGGNKSSSYGYTDHEKTARQANNRVYNNNVKINTINNNGSSVQTSKVKSVVS